MDIALFLSLFFQKVHICVVVYNMHFTVAIRTKRNSIAYSVYTSFRNPINMMYFEIRLPFIILKWCRFFT